MSVLWEFEEADREAAERARVAEWVAEHPDPVTAALARAVRAEAEVARLSRTITLTSDAEEEARELAHAIDEWGGCFDCCTDSGAEFDRLRPNDEPSALNGERIEAALLDLVRWVRVETLAGFIETRRRRLTGEGGAS